MRERFRNDRRVRLVAAVQAGQCAVAGAFFFDDRLQKDRCGGLEADHSARATQSLGDDASLHVAGCRGHTAGHRAPPDRTAGATTCPRRLRHDVDVAVQDQRPSVCIAGRHAPTTLSCRSHLPPKANSRQVFRSASRTSKRSVVKAHAAEQPFHEILRARFVAVQRRKTHQRRCQFDHVVLEVLDAARMSESRAGSRVSGAFMLLVL